MSQFLSGDSRFRFAGDIPGDVPEAFMQLFGLFFFMITIQTTLL